MPCFEYDNSLYGVSKRIRRVLQFIPDNIKQKTEEIRLRVGLPVCLTVESRVLFMKKNSSVSEKSVSDCITASQDDLNESLALLCGNSVYLHENEIKNGYISLPFGNRAGVCGVFNTAGMLTSVTSLNIRIARQIFGVAAPLLDEFDGGMLIAGPPGSGKTTMLRDLIRLLSGGAGGKYFKVAVIDSRGEISGGLNGGCVNNLGENTDVLYSANKASGTQIALRTMFPDVIAFDEIGTKDELNSVIDCFNAGVKIITTAHCNSKNDIMNRRVTSEIIKSGAVSKAVILNGQLGSPPQILNIGEFCANVCD